MCFSRLILLTLACNAAADATVTITANFDGGSLGRIEKISERHFRLAVQGEKDQDGRNRQASWYYFRVDGAGSAELTLDLVDLAGEYNYTANRGAITGDTPPVISYDRNTWTHVPAFDYDEKEPRLRLRITPVRARFWIAHVPPYTEKNLEALRKLVRSEEVIGKTAGGGDLYLWTFGPPEASKTVWLMFRQHSWESGSSWVAEGAVRELLKDAHGIQWKIMPLCDPDGVARGGVRFNKFGYDLNRNWDVDNPATMPEIHSQRDAVLRWVRNGRKVDLFLSLHNTETQEYLAGMKEFRALGDRFHTILTETTSFNPSRPLSDTEATTTPGMKGRMTAVQGLYRDARVPGYLMEQRISYNSKLKRLPLPEDRIRFGRELVAAIAQALSDRD